MIDFQKLSEWVAYSINTMVYDIIKYVPNIFLSLIVLLFGYFVATILANILKRILDYLNVEEIFKKYKVEDALGGKQLTPIFIKLFRWYLMLFFFVAAVEILQFPQLQLFLNLLLTYIPLLFGSALLIILAAIVGEWIKESVLELHKFFGQKQIAEILRWFLVLVAITVSLETMGFKTSIINQLIISIVQGIVFGISLAFALAFGLGGQKDAAEIIKKVRKKLEV
ncbi:MAG: mechanosensitive ion channel family protein [Candidatus Anstonellaceae archaeon]